MPLLAFLSMDSLAGFVSDDELAVSPLHKYGFTVKTISWRPFMVQPFLSNIIEEGEYSLFYFGGEYSHAILKTPRKNDFRVQEEHGGIINPVPANDELKARGAFILNSLTKMPLYARMDFVRNGENHFAIMEVELIEPALYFRMDHPGAAERFAHAVNNWAGSI